MINYVVSNNLNLIKMKNKNYRTIKDIDFESLMNHLAEDMQWANAEPRIATKGDIEDNNLQKFGQVITLFTMPSQSNKSEIKECIEKFSDDMHFKIRRGGDQSRRAEYHEYYICFFKTTTETEAEILLGKLAKFVQKWEAKDQKSFNNNMDVDLAIELEKYLK